MITAATGVAPDGWAQILPLITWPGAVALLAYSPPAKSLANWLQKRAGAAPAHHRELPPEMMELIRDIAQAVERVSESQARQAEVLGKVVTDLKVLLDRVPRPR